MSIGCKIAQCVGLLLIVTSALSGQGSRQNKAPIEPKASSEAPKPESVPMYTIQPNDVLEIFVWKEPDLTRKVLVRPDGRISFPLVQDMLVAGSSPGELKEAIEKRLKEYIEIPYVTVIIDAIQSYRIFVTGKVQKPGGILAEKPITVLQALALAGGFQEFANLSDMTIIRSSETDNKVFRFNYEEVIKGKNSDQNILLRTGDVVVVP